MRISGWSTDVCSSELAWGAATADPWRTEKQEDGVRVSSRAVVGSPIRAIKAEADIRAPFASVVALLLNVSLRPRWDETCAEASVYLKVSDAEDVIYVHSDLQIGRAHV